jgi:hypothetical protein
MRPSNLYTAPSLASLLLALLFLVPASYDSAILARIRKHEIVQDPADQQPIGSPHKVKLLSTRRIISGFRLIRTGRID